MDGCRHLFLSKLEFLSFVVCLLLSFTIQNLEAELFSEATGRHQVSLPSVGGSQLVIGRRGVSLETEGRSCHEEILLHLMKQSILQSVGRVENVTVRERCRDKLNETAVVTVRTTTTTTHPHPQSITLQEYAEDVKPGSSNEGLVQFKFHLNDSVGGSTRTDKRVISADMMVYVKAKQPRRVTILVYQLDDQDGGDERVGGRGYGGQQREPIAQLTRTMRNTKWQRLLLPTSIIQKAIDSPERVVRMRIVCENCDDATETITAVKVSVGRKQKTREGNRKNQRPEVGKSVRKLRNNKRRPYLVVKTMMAE